MPAAEQVQLAHDAHRVAVALLQLAFLALVRGQVGGDEAVGRATDSKGDADSALATRELLRGNVRAERIVRRAEGRHLGGDTVCNGVCNELYYLRRAESRYLGGDTVCNGVRWPVNGR